MREDKRQLIEQLIDLYVHNSNLTKDVKPSAFRKHILGEEEEIMILNRQAKINRMIIGMIDAVLGKHCDLNHNISPFFVKKNSIIKELLGEKR